MILLINKITRCRVLNVLYKNYLIQIQKYLSSAKNTQL